MAAAPQLLALCHRAIEVEAEPYAPIPLFDMPLAATPSGGSVGTKASLLSSAIQSAQPQPRFLVVLRGSAVLTCRPQPGAAPWLPEGRVPIHRLRANDHVGTIAVLRYFHPAGD